MRSSESCHKRCLFKHGKKSPLVGWLLLTNHNAFFKICLWHWVPGKWPHTCRLSCHRKEDFRFGGAVIFQEDRWFLRSPKLKLCRFYGGKVSTTKREKEKESKSSKSSFQISHSLLLLLPFQAFFYQGEVPNKIFLNIKNAIKNEKVANWNNLFIFAEKNWVEGPQSGNCKQPLKFVSLLHLLPQTHLEVGGRRL